MQFGARGQQRLRPQDVGPAGQRSIGKPHGVPGDGRLDVRPSGVLVEVPQAVVPVVPRDHVAAVVRDGRTGQRRQDALVDTGQSADHAQLASRRGHRAEVAVVESGRGQLSSARPSASPRSNAASARVAAA